VKTTDQLQYRPMTSVDTNSILCAHFTSRQERTKAKKTASWDVPSCSLIETYQLLRVTYLEQLVLLKRLQISSRFYRVSHPRSIFHRHRRENLKHRSGYDVCYHDNQICQSFPSSAIPISLHPLAAISFA
jgi:hypothetical protein